MSLNFGSRDFEDFKLVPKAVVNLDVTCMRRTYQPRSTRAGQPDLPQEQEQDDDDDDDSETRGTDQVLIPPSIASKLVCGLKTEIPFAESLSNEAWRVSDSFMLLFPPPRVDVDVDGFPCQRSSV